MRKCHTTGIVSSNPCRLPPVWSRVSPESVGSNWRRPLWYMPVSLGKLDTPKCICGAEEQSAIHITLDCDILLPPNCLEDLRSPDINNAKWLEDLVDFV